jgi:hypothetical protein
MELTQKQIDELKKKGFDEAKISAMSKKFGYELPKPKKGLLQKATDVVTSIFPGGKVGESIGTLAGYGITAGKEKLGLVPKGTTSQYDLSAPTPLQVGGDIVKGATMIAGAKLPIATSVLGKTAQFGTLGAISGGAEAVAQGKSGTDVLKSTAIGGAVGGATGAVFGLAEKGIKGMANLFGKAGDKIQTTIIKPSAKDIKDGFSLDTIKKYNLGGSLKQTFEKTDTTLDSLSKQLNQKLNASGKSPVLDLNKVYENTAKKLLGNKLESFGANTQMEGAIDKLRNEISAVVGKNGLTSVQEAQIIKRAAGHFGAWSYGVPTPEATASQKVYDTFYNELKTAIEKASPEGVKEINQQISKLIPVMNALIRRIPVAERNSALSLTDIITLSAATLEPRALSLSLLNLASKSGRVGSALSKLPQIGEKAAKGIQKIEPVARTIIGR